MDPIVLQTGLLVVVGAVGMLAVAHRPALLWPALIVSATGTLGLMLDGYALVDEFLVACVLAGGLLAVAVGSVPRRRERADAWHLALFVLLTLYLAWQSLRSPLVWEVADWRISRWVLFYPMLTVLAMMTSMRAFAVPSPPRAAGLIAGSVAVYLAAYLAHGYITETVRGMSRWAVQGVEWAGSAYAVFPLLVGLPAALLLWRDGRAGRRRLAYATLALAVLAGYYYDSRAAFLTLAAFVGLSWPALGPRTFLRLIALAVAPVVLVIWLFYGRVTADSAIRFGRMVFGPVANPGQTDLDRLLHTRAGERGLARDTGRFWIGDGLYGHRFGLPELLQAVGLDVRDDVVRTTGFAALLFDTGLAGALLVAGNAALAVRQVMRGGRNGARIYSVGAIGLAVLWLLVSNILDVVLLYLAIMPGGPLMQLARFEPAAAIGPPSPRLGPAPT